MDTQVNLDSENYGRILFIWFSFLLDAAMAHQITTGSRNTGNHGNYFLIVSGFYVGLHMHLEP